MNNLTPAATGPAAPWSAAEVIQRPIDELSVNPTNARTHSPAQIRKIKRSLEQFGFVTPVLIDRDDRIVAGHGRVRAAKALSLATVPTLRLDRLTDAQCRAYALADNKTAELAGWDSELLRLELGAVLELDSRFDLTAIGFEDPELDLLLVGPADTEQSPDIAATDHPPTAAVTQTGDLWLLGEHRIVCGDARDAAAYDTLLGDERAAMMFADPPYNVAIAGNVSSTGRHAEFAMASGEMSPEAFRTFLSDALGLAARYSRAGAVHDVCMDWRHIQDLLSVGTSVYDALLNICVWDKGTGGMGSLYRSQHELICVFRAGKGRHRNNVQLGRFGRNRSNVWGYPGASSLGGELRRQSADHPTPKPIELVTDAILDVTKAGDLVLDPFGGSGTTMLAAERSSRRARLIELEGRYVDLSIRRWQRATGGSARLANTGQTFDEVSGTRS
jgi:hypothetical protein